MDGLQQLAQTIDATCSSLAVPGANKIPASLKHLLWGFLEPNTSRRLMPADVVAARVLRNYEVPVNIDC